jgi:hypothetical protein
MRREDDDLFATRSGDRTLGRLDQLRVLAPTGHQQVAEVEVEDARGDGGDLSVHDGDRRPRKMTKTLCGPGSVTLTKRTREGLHCVGIALITE